MKGTECFVSVQTSVVLTELCNVMVNSEELIGTAEYRDAIDQMLHKPTSVQPAVTVFVVANVMRRRVIILCHYCLRYPVCSFIVLTSPF